MGILYAYQMLAGMVLVILSPNLQAVLEAFRATEWGGGALFFSYFLGGTLSTLSVSWLARLLSTRAILQASAGLCGVGLAGFSRTGALAPAVAWLFVVGSMNAILICYPGALLASRHRERSGRPISLLYTFFAAGVMVCPSLSGFLLARGVDWRVIFMAAGVGAGICALAAAFVRLPALTDAEGLHWRSFQEARRGDRGLLLGAILLNILYIGSETSVIGWMVYYLQTVFGEGTSVFRASRVLTYFWLAMILGRMLTAVVVDRLGSFFTLMGLVCGGFAVWSCALLSQGLVQAETLFALIGLCFSGVFPVLAAYAGRFPLRYTGLTFSLILAGGGMGGMLFPLLVGSVAAAHGIRSGLAAGLAAPVGMVLVLLVLRGRGARV